MVYAAGVMVAGAIVGGAVKANGAKKAAGTQADAAREAAEIERLAAEKTAQNFKDAASIRSDAIGAARNQAISGLGQSTDITKDAINSAGATQTNAINVATNNLIADAEKAQTFYESTLIQGTQDQIAAAKKVMEEKSAAANQAMEAITGARTRASESYQGTVDKVNADYRQSMDKSIGYIDNSTGEANTTLKDMYKTNMAMYDTSKAMYDPYVKSGLEANTRLTEGTRAGGEFDHRFGEVDMVKDGGYQFRLKEGMQAVENSAAARGGLLSGNALRGVTEYGQGFASNEYDKAYGRFNNDMDTRFSRLSSLANRGMDATGKVGEITGRQVDLGTGMARDVSGNLIRAGENKSGIEMQGGQYMGNNNLGAGKYTAEGIASNGLVQGQTLRDIGGYRADNAQAQGDISAASHERWGQTRGDMMLRQSQLDADRIVNVGNIAAGSTTALGKANAGYASGVAQLMSDGTLAIGNATADGVIGAAGATERGAQAQAGGVIGAGNATSAGQAATGQIWGNAINQAANGFTSFYTMGKKPPT